MSRITVPLPKGHTVGSLYTIEVADQPVMLIQLAGDWLAFADVCPHSGCALSADGELDESVLICSCHGLEFDLPAGTVRRGPARKPLTRYLLHLKGDFLEIDLAQGEGYDP